MAGLTTVGHMYYIFMQPTKCTLKNEEEEEEWTKFKTYRNVKMYDVMSFDCSAALL